MAFSDPIAEFLTKLRNALKARHRFVDISVSKMKLALAEILKEHGYIENYLTNENKRVVRIFLKYTTKARNPVVRSIKRVSSPGLRKYVSYQKIPKILGGIGCVILSTPKGVMDDKKARELKVGGEMLCYIY